MYLGVIIWTIVTSTWIYDFFILTFTISSLWILCMLQVSVYSAQPGDQRFYSKFTTLETFNLVQISHKFGKGSLVIEWRDEILYLHLVQIRQTRLQCVCVPVFRTGEQDDNEDHLWGANYLNSSAHFYYELLVCIGHSGCT